MLLDVRDMSLSFFSGARKVSVLDKLSFSIQDNEVMALLGESGSGKTLTALSVMGLYPRGGSIDPGSRILYKGQDLVKLPQQAMQKIRGHKISIVFQEPMNALNPVYTIGKQMAEILTVHTGCSEKDALKEALLMLSNVAIQSPELCLASYPHHLSGGMKQRVLLAMSLLCKPDLVIADEITTALDACTQVQIFTLLKSLQKRFSLSILFITHNFGIAEHISDKVSIMYAGRIVESGPTRAVLQKPLHPYTQGLLSAIPVLGKRKELQEIPGLFPDGATYMKGGCRFAGRCRYKQAECLNKEPNLLPVTKDHKVRCILVSAQ